VIETGYQVAEYFYVTFITLAEFDLTGGLKGKLTPAFIWDIANLRRKVKSPSIRGTSLIIK